ncbi:MAG: RAMP superfamily CRISPR-associated protein [Bacteroidota bacterium]
MITHVYTIRALTNLHVGSSGTDYGIVDKLVQRDPATKFPTIHMSGIKGALRQYFRDELKADTREIFGSEVQDKAAKVKPGKVRFISADLLAFPCPSKSAQAGKPFELMRCHKVAKEFDAKIALFTAWKDWAQNKLPRDKRERDRQSEAFAELTRNLPIVARNYLNNGVSENLWYEEFVPREAVFATIIQGPKAQMKELQEIDGKVIQIGGNATVGYGYCLFTLENKTPEQ